MAPRRRYDLATERDAVRDMLYYSETFYLDPAQWRKFTTIHTLVWEKYRFTRANRSNVPKDPGVYAFVAEFAGGGLPPHGYILYFGITGPTSGRHLWKRYGEYLEEQVTGKRFALYMMLNDYEENLFFCFARLQATRTELKVLEKSFLDAFQPPVNERDFSAEIMRRRKVL